MRSERAAIETFRISSVAITAVLLLSFAACGPASQPPEGPKTDYPCGRWEVSCGNGACCPWAHICGVEGDPRRRCEIGYCCKDGDPMYGSAAGDGGASGAPLRQRQSR